MELRVETPSHYLGGIEPIDFIQKYDLDFCMGNIIKYCVRAGKKEYYVRDLRKIIDYLEFMYRYPERVNAQMNRIPNLEAEEFVRSWEVSASYCTLRVLDILFHSTVFSGALAVCTDLLNREIAAYIANKKKEVSDD